MVFENKVLRKRFGNSRYEGAESRKKKCIIYNLYSSPCVLMTAKKSRKITRIGYVACMGGFIKQGRCWLGVIGVDNRNWMLKKWGAKSWTGCLGPVEGFCK
jgi:hypothetical protein